MNNEFKYVITNDNATVFIKGEAFVVNVASPNFAKLREAILSNKPLSEVIKYLTVKSTVDNWANGKFRIVNNTVQYNGKEMLCGDISKRLFEMISNNENPDYLLRFYENLSKNPSHRSVSQLFSFLNHLGIPITSDGCFLAYKGVNMDYLDCHSRTISNKPGSVVKMDRNNISDDPNHACHAGLHVGALEYAASFGKRVVICKINPMNVVCVPNDHSYMKMRVCEYEVVGEHNGDYMPSTTIADEDYIATCEICGCAVDGFEDDICEECFYDDVNNAKTYHALDNMHYSELMMQSTEDLRKYASNTLKIVGASRIRGGKHELVNAILKVRNSYTKSK